VLPPSKKLRQIATTSNATRYNNILQQRYKNRIISLFLLFYVKLRQNFLALKTLKLSGLPLLIF